MAASEDFKDEPAASVAAPSDDALNAAALAAVSSAAAVDAPATAGKPRTKPSLALQTSVAPVALDPAVSTEAPKVVEEAPAAPVAKRRGRPPKAAGLAKAPAIQPTVAPKAAAQAATIKAPKVPAPKPKPVVPAKPAAAAARKVPAKPPLPAKVAPIKSALKPARAAPRPTAVPRSAIEAAASKTAPKAENTFAGLFTPFILKDTTMDMSANFTGLQDAVSEAQGKAKAAFEKGTAMLGEVTEFTKGNVEAVMESGKIFADGVQGLGSELVSEGRSAFETMTADIKELAAVKSPTDFFKIQGDMARKNFDSAVAYGSKNSEAMLKLMSDVFAPISGRVSVAMEKARAAAPTSITPTF